MADDPQLNQVLVTILEMLKQHSRYLHRLHGWVIAASETLERHPEFEAKLREHPFFDQGRDPLIQNTDVMIRNIDALIQQLRKN